MKPSLVIVGLGNPGAAYRLTRHNAGFWAADVLAREIGTGVWRPKQKLLCETCEGRVLAVPVLLAKPTTFMNDSGRAARKVVDFFGLDPGNQLLVLCDDIDLPAGEARLRPSGGAGTHNGLQSLVDQFGEAFPRLRIGVRGTHAPKGSFRHAGEDLSAYVLSRPDGEEQSRIEEAVGNVPAMVRKFVMK